MKIHPLRKTLNDEVHARPFASLTTPVQATHLALLTGEHDGAQDRRHVARLCDDFGIARPDESAVHAVLDFDDFTLKWERHAEFSTYTFIHQGPGTEPPFSTTAIARVPTDWVMQLPGELLVGQHVEVLARDDPEPNPEQLATIFGNEKFCGSLMAGGAAAAWMDFTIAADGYGRMLVHDRQLAPRQAGRLVQRLLEIDTYRMMALLALPLAREVGPKLGSAANRLVEIAGQMAAIEEVGDERRLLDELVALSAEIERVAAATGFRFSAARAYGALVDRRIEELREERLEGLQTVGEFMDRRLSPATRTCMAVGDRVDRLSRRLARTSQLLRTRVDVQLEAQNQALLQSMDRRARLQLRLQQTVEGLSVAAITYYVVGLVAYAAKALEAGGLRVHTELSTGVAIPVVAGFVWYGVRRIRRLVTRQGEAAGS